VRVSTGDPGYGNRHQPGGGFRFSDYHGGRTGSTTDGSRVSRCAGSQSLPTCTDSLTSNVRNCSAGPSRSRRASPGCEPARRFHPGQRQATRFPPYFRPRSRCTLGIHAIFAVHPRNSRNLHAAWRFYLPADSRPEVEDRTPVSKASKSALRGVRIGVPPQRHF
jgi:hypothetical protein